MCLIHQFASSTTQADPSVNSTAEARRGHPHLHPAACTPSTARTPPPWPVAAAAAPRQRLAAAGHPPLEPTPSTLRPPAVVVVAGHTWGEAAPDTSRLVRACPPHTCTVVARCHRRPLFSVVAAAAAAAVAVLVVSVAFLSLTLLRPLWWDPPRTGHPPLAKTRTLWMCPPGTMETGMTPAPRRPRCGRGLCPFPRRRRGGGGCAEALPSTACLEEAFWAATVVGAGCFALARLRWMRA
ncbi:unnamed protein product, partial [Laminaria digitata]